MTSSASICSVTRIVPIDEVMKEPTFPAMITEINEGANSKMIDCRVAKPTKYLGNNGLSVLMAVWMATTPPTKNEIKATMPKEPMIRSSISLMISFHSTFHFVNFLNVF